MGEIIATREAYGRALCEFGADENIMVFDADLTICTMSCYFAQKYPERFFNAGIAECNMAGMAAGAASCGKTAFIHTFAMFAAGRIYDQVRNSIAYPGLNVKVVGTHAGLSVGEDGATHQCIEDLSLMRTIPGMTVICPCDANETREVVKAMIDYDGPCYLRLGRSGVENITDSIPGYKFELGKGAQLKDGDDVTIIIIKAAKETGAIVTTEEHNVIGGLGAAVAEVVTESCPVPVVKHGVEDVFGHSGTAEALMVKYGLTPEKIVEKAKQAIALKK